MCSSEERIAAKIPFLALDEQTSNVNAILGADRMRSFGGWSHYISDDNGAVSFSPTTLSYGNHGRQTQM